MTPDREIHKVRGFVQKSNKHWVSSEMYSLPDLLKQAKGGLELTKQLKALAKPQKQYNQEKVTKLLDQTSLKLKIVTIQLLKHLSVLKDISCLIH